MLLILMMLLKMSKRFNQNDEKFDHLMDELRNINNNFVIVAMGLFYVATSVVE